MDLTVDTKKSLDHFLCSKFATILNIISGMGEGEGACIIV